VKFPSNGTALKVFFLLVVFFFLRTVSADKYSFPYAPFLRRWKAQSPLVLFRRSWAEQDFPCLRGVRRNDHSSPTPSLRNLGIGATLCYEALFSYSLESCRNKNSRRTQAVVILRLSCVPYPGVDLEVLSSSLFIDRLGAALLKLSEPHVESSQRYARCSLFLRPQECILKCTPPHFLRDAPPVLHHLLSLFLSTLESRLLRRRFRSLLIFRCVGAVAFFVQRYDRM